jgi:RNA polymerase sigma-70 factor, ECF subfamily
MKFSKGTCQAAAVRVPEGCRPRNPHEKAGIEASHASHGPANEERSRAFRPVIPPESRRFPVPLLATGGNTGMMDTRALVLDDDLLIEELGWLRTVAQRLLADPNDAEDVVQETWLRTRRAPPSFESRGRLRAWLAAVARRMARDTLRARRRRAAREERAARLEARLDAEDVVERSGQIERLLRAVRALEEPQRSTVLLRYLDGYSTAEIASAMGVSEELVRKRLARTRTQLRAALGLDVEAPTSRGRGAVQAAGLFVLLVLGLGGLSRTPESLRGGVGDEAAEPGHAQGLYGAVERAADGAPGETSPGETSPDGSPLDVAAHTLETDAPAPAGGASARAVSIGD